MDRRRQDDQSATPSNPVIDLAIHRACGKVDQGCFQVQSVAVYVTALIFRNSTMYEVLLPVRGRPELSIDRPFVCDFNSMLIFT